MSKSERDAYVRQAVQRIAEYERRSAERFADLLDVDYLVDHRGAIGARRVA